MSTKQQPKHEVDTLWSVAVAVLLSLACAQSGPKTVAPAREIPVMLPVIGLGIRQTDTLTCKGDPCARWYKLAIDRSERISIEVLSNSAAVSTDYGLGLYNQKFEVLVHDRAPYQRPRQVTAKLSPGSYYVRVEGLTDLEVPLEFTLLAIAGPRSQFSAPESRPIAKPKQQPARTAPAERPKASSRPVARPVARPSALPTPPQKAASQPRVPQLPTRTQVVSELPADPIPLIQPAVQPFVPLIPPLTPQPMQMQRIVLVRSEVIEIERTAGVPVAVMIEAGAPTGVSQGLTGRLVDDGREIGRIEILDVYPGASRAKILGELSGEITGATIAEVFDPLE